MLHSGHAGDSPVGGVVLTDRDFQRIQETMYERTGVLLKSSKKPLVVARLRKRLLELGMSTFAQYLAHLAKQGEAEMEILVNAITTNETFFFRHSEQFNMLYESILPEICAAREASGGELKLQVWSAACSSGEELYSLAIALLEFFKSKPRWRFKVCASDINTEVLREAAAGEYGERSVKYVSDTLKERYFRKVDGAAGHSMYVLKPALKQYVEFRQHNLLSHVEVQQGLDTSS
ncbi:MAG: protein-glutamate O-methyltransferase CheR [Elusimicrobia bacterium]|nr:protein-glutamate O-methyltransferase CheR [Elusimicrobiota bacterium]